MSKVFSTTDVISRTRWYIRLRWLFVCVLILSGLVPLIITAGWGGPALRGVILGGIALFTNGIFYQLARFRSSDSYYRRLAVSVVVVDVLFITFIIFMNGGIESRTPILYTVPVLMTAAIFGRPAVYATAGAAVIAYSGLVVAEYFRLIDSYDVVTNHSDEAADVVSSIVFFGAILLLIGFLADFITNLLLQKERHASNVAEALKRAQSVAKLGSWEWDIINDRLLWSEELHKILGVKHSPTPAGYSAYIKRVHPDDKQFVTKKLQSAIKTHKPFQFDHRIMRRGKAHTIHIEGRALVDKHGKTLKLYGTAQDITSERALDLAKTDFVSLASHQLRTPATGVKITLSLLKEGYAGELAPQQQELITQAYETNERQLKLANDILNITRLESGNFRPRKREIDLRLWTQDMAAQLKDITDSRKQKLVVTTPNAPVYVWADPDMLGMVVDNLVSNASKYTPKRGYISMNLNANPAMARISVTDSGPGIARHEITKLFKKFTPLDTRLNSEVVGSGLGLYLAKGIMQLHKGSITVQSKPGEGATFVLSVPRKSRSKRSKSRN